MITKDNIEIVPIRYPYESPFCCEISPSTNEITVWIHELIPLEDVFDYHFHGDYSYTNIVVNYHVDTKVIDPIAVCYYDNHGECVKEFDYPPLREEIEIVADKIEKYIFDYYEMSCANLIADEKNRRNRW